MRRAPIPRRARRPLSAAVAALGVLAVAGACSREERRAPVPTDGQAHAVRRGDRVVVEARAAEFFEGRVLSVDKGRLRVEVAGREPLIVAQGDVYRLPPAGRDLLPGQLAVCRREGRWNGCRIESREGEALRVQGIDGVGARVAADAVLAPTPLTELTLKQRFAEVAARAEFTRAAAHAGRPLAPPGFRLLPRARVVARRQNGWHSGMIHEIEDDGAYVEFRADGLREPIGNHDIVPEPPYPQRPARDDFVLVRPESPTLPWKPVRVRAATQNEFKVSDENGDERIVSPRDILPLARPAE